MLGFSERKFPKLECRHYVTDFFVNAFPVVLVLNLH